MRRRRAASSSPGRVVAGGTSLSNRRRNRPRRLCVCAVFAASIETFEKEEKPLAKRKCDVANLPFEGIFGDGPNLLDAVGSQEGSCVGSRVEFRKIPLDFT